MILGQLIALLYSILSGGLLSDQIIFHLAVKYMIKFALADLQCNPFPLKLPNL